MTYEHLQRTITYEAHHIRRTHSGIDSNTFKDLVSFHVLSRYSKIDKIQQFSKISEPCSNTVLTITK